MKRILAAGALCMAVGATLAHAPNKSNIPVLRCWHDAAEVVCRSGWSRGNPMGKATLEMIGPDGKSLATLMADAKGLARFAKPQGRFTVLLHDVRGNGQTVEVDQRDVDTGKPGM